MTTGMIDPFDITNVKGVTYTCHFSGKYYYWKGNENNPQKKTEADDSTLVLRPNSITYLEIEEEFRVPDYLIIRYNLQVNHVYKGLLLGTGPIVDPGFVGRLYIPLHNLTSNEYQIKKGAALITLEFTKVGRNRKGDPGSSWPRAEISAWNFSDLCHQPENIKPGRDFNVYLRKALIENEDFRKRTDNICVGSSIPEKIESAEQAALDAQKSAKASENSLNRVQAIILGIGLFAIISIVIAAITLGNDLHARIDDILSYSIPLIAENDQLKKDNDILTKENNRLKEENTALQDEIDKLGSGGTETQTE